MFKANNRNTRTRCENCTKLTIKTPKRRQWRRSGVFIVNFEHISHLPIMFLLLTLSSKCWLGMRYSYFATKQETFPSNPISLFIHTLMVREKERFTEAECESKTLVNQCSNIDTCEDISPIFHGNYFRLNKAVNTGTIDFLKFSRGIERKH